ncbi:MAG TPA: hypothetical protein VMV15_10990 [Candidatus Binataceae bacterium]|nr:hypothetical protein [Candidatus Binataceae bacterium]
MKTKLILIIALMLLIAGFITRRMLMPIRGPHRSAPQRFGAAADRSEAAAGPRAMPAGARPDGENLSDVDRRELGALIRNRTSKAR